MIVLATGEQIATTADLRRFLEGVGFDDWRHQVGDLHAILCGFDSVSDPVAQVERLGRELDEMRDDLDDALASLDVANDARWEAERDTRDLQAQMARVRTVARGMATRLSAAGIMPETIGEDGSKDLEAAMLSALGLEE